MARLKEAQGTIQQFRFPAVINIRCGAGLDRMSGDKGEHNKLYTIHTLCIYMYIHAYGDGWCFSPSP